MREQFNDPSLYDLALTHRSLSATVNNQRLEFLGDRVLGLVVAEMIYHTFPEAREGDMARRHAALVSGPTLVEVATEAGLAQVMRIADGEGEAGRTNASNLEDVCEALIGAIYLDLGMADARTFIERYWTPLLTRMKAPPKDAKTALQEWAQGQSKPLPVYEELERVGPDHAPQFTIQVCVQGEEPAQAQAASKRAAEQQAAQSLLERVGVL